MTAPQQPQPTSAADPAVATAGPTTVPPTRQLKQTERPSLDAICPRLAGLRRDRHRLGSGDRHGHGRQLDTGGLTWILPILGIVVVLAAIAGFVAWYFTRFVIDDEELRIETGAIFKKSTKIPFERLQSVDIIQPLVARIFGLAELRLDAGNSTPSCATWPGQGVQIARLSADPGPWTAGQHSRS